MVPVVIANNVLEVYVMVMVVREVNFQAAIPAKIPLWMFLHVILAVDIRLLIGWQKIQMIDVAVVKKPPGAVPINFYEDLCVN